MKITFPTLFSILTLTSLSLSSSLTLAQDQQMYSGWSLSTNIDHINFDTAAASRWDAMVADSATSLGLAGEYFDSESSMTYVVGLSYIAYNDNNEFSQYVEDQGYYNRNEHHYEESSANALMLFAEAGPKIHFGTDNSSFFTARAGISEIFDSTRSIEFCNDCYSEDINLEGGLYGALGIGHSFHRFDIGIEFHQYFTGDIDNSLGLKMAFSF